MPRFLLLAALLLIQLPFAHSAKAQGAPVTAAVNLQEVFTNCPQATGLQTKLQALQAEINADLQGRQTEIQKLQSQLEEIALNTPEYAKKQEEILLSGLNLQAYQEFQQARARREQLSGFLNLYQSVQAAIESVAKAQGIDIVLQHRSATMPQVENYEQMQAAVTSRIVLYASEKAMITDLVLEQLTLMNKQ